MSGLYSNDMLYICFREVQCSFKYVYATVSPFFSNWVWKGKNRIVKGQEVMDRATAMTTFILVERERDRICQVFIAV